MKVLVIGSGSIGARHARNLKMLGVSEILLADSNPARLREITNELNVSGTSLEEGLRAKPDAALICTPPHLHVRLALEAVRAGCHCFLEKPISDTLEGVDELISEARRRKRKLMVGYNLRFQAGTRHVKDLLAEGVAGRILYVRAEVGSYLPDWRPWQDYSQSYTTRKDMGGGIILDASHELDLVRSFLGEVKQVFCAADQLGDFAIEVEDTAEITLWFQNGALGSVHLDMLQRVKSRYCKLVGTKGSIVLDFIDDTVNCFSSETKEWQARSYPQDVNQMYIDEMKHFLDCVANEAEPAVSAEDGRAALEIALAAKESARAGRMVDLAISAAK